MAAFVGDTLLPRLNQIERQLTELERLRFESLEQRLVELEKRIDRQDTRWERVTAATGTGRLDARAALHQMMVKAFSLADMATLCLEMDIEYDELPGDTISHKVTSLIAYIGRRNQRSDGEWDLSNLVKKLKEKRPSYKWPDV